MFLISLLAGHNLKNKYHSMDLNLGTDIFVCKTKEILSIIWNPK